jgi:hypothetical protein
MTLKKTGAGWLVFFLILSFGARLQKAVSGFRNKNQKTRVQSGKNSLKAD